MHAIRLFPAVAACALLLGACNSSDRAFDARVHDYIINHPEVLQEAMAKLQARQDAVDAAKAKIAIAQYRPALERDPRDFVANPNGRITVTEFYDYRCPHCINAAPAVLKIIHDEPDVRFVFKEFPIFGAISEKAAAGAIVLKKQGGDELSLYRDFMAARPLDEAAIDRILRAHGVDPTKLDHSPAGDEARSQMLAVRTLATNMGIEGTPAFIIGDTLVPGEDMDEVNAAIAAARNRRG
jgi:protein-disulfide isomerase